MRLYGLKNCDTCRKALSDLRKSGQDVTLVDISETGVSVDFARRLYAELGERILNRRSTTWRNLPESERYSPPQDLVAAHPKLMKRPVIETSTGTLHPAWTAADRAEFIS